MLEGARLAEARLESLNLRLHILKKRRDSLLLFADRKPDLDVSQGRAPNMDDRITLTTSGLLRLGCWRIQEIRQKDAVIELRPKDDYVAARIGIAVVHNNCALTNLRLRLSRPSEKDVSGPNWTSLRGDGWRNEA